MIRHLALMSLFGKPLVLYFGILVFVFLIFTASVGFLNFRGIRLIPFRWHPRLALMLILLAIFHALLGLSIYFNF